MRDLRATVVTAIATYPLRLIEVARDEGFDLDAAPLRVGILGSEMWSDELRARIERELRHPDLRHHRHDGDGRPRPRDRLRGAGRHPRVGGPLLCGDRRPGHRARRVPDGVEGELVVSTLTREGLPLVRYRTHDLTRVVSREPCACGRTSLRLDRLRGRTDDMVIFKGVNFYPHQVETLLLRQPGVSHEYQIVLDSDGGGERMTILVETEPGGDRGAWPSRIGASCTTCWR